MENRMGNFVILPIDQHGVVADRPKMRAGSLATCLTEMESLKRDGQCSWVIMADD